MTGPENYSTAEQILAEYEVIIEQGGDPGDMLQLAQVRALLASTAAFAMAQPVAGMSDEQGLDQGDFDDWYAAVNGLPPESRKPVEEYPGELDHLRALLSAVKHAAKQNDASDPLNEILIDHYSDARIVDAEITMRGVSRG